MFDEIPEDRERSEPCRCGGSLTDRGDGRWACNKCDWVSVLSYPTGSFETGTEAEQDE